jgi:hypothetical protein
LPQSSMRSTHSSTVKTSTSLPTSISNGQQRLPGIIWHSVSSRCFGHLTTSCLSPRKNTKQPLRRSETSLNKSVPRAKPDYSKVIVPRQRRRRRRSSPRGVALSATVASQSKRPRSSQAAYGRRRKVHIIGNRGKPWHPSESPPSFKPLTHSCRSRAGRSDRLAS